MNHLLRKLWRDDEGQDIAEYAVMLAVILVLVVGTIRLIGSNANSVFSVSSQFTSINRSLRISDPLERETNKCTSHSCCS